MLIVNTPSYKLTSNLPDDRLFQMSLKDELAPLVGVKRRFLLLRIVDTDVETALGLCGVKIGSYNTWCRDIQFVSLNQRREELSAQYRDEAIRLLRKRNQLDAILLEEEIIKKLREEIETGDYALARTHLAREVYSKLIADLDVSLQVPGLTWIERLQQLFVGEQPEVIGGSYAQLETTGSQPTQFEKGSLITESK